MQVNVVMIWILLMLILPENESHQLSNVHVVKITGNKFVPAVIEINFGDIVVWQNESAGKHTVIAEDGNFQSPVLKKGESFRHTFRKTGVFRYRCQRHKITARRGSIKVFIR
jgi:plastocyanin